MYNHIHRLRSFYVHTSCLGTAPHVTTLKLCRYWKVSKKQNLLPVTCLTTKASVFHYEKEDIICAWNMLKCVKKFICHFHQYTLWKTKDVYISALGNNTTETKNLGSERLQIVDALFPWFTTQYIHIMSVAFLKMVWSWKLTHL